MTDRAPHLQGDPRLRDKLWRLNHLYKIKSISKDVVKFKLNRAQADFHSRKTKRNIILKSRKLGFTTYFAVDGLDDCLFVPNTDALMLSYDIPSQVDIFDEKVVFAWDNFNEELKELYTLDAERANKLKFNWGDKSTTSITVRLSGRSGTYSKLHISEFGKISKIDPSSAKEIVSGTIQAVPLSGEVNIESTAEGDYGEFYEMFMEAWKRGPAKTPVDFTAFFYNWTYDDQELSKIIPLPEDELPKEFREYRQEHALSLTEITYYYYKWLTLNRDWKLLRREYPTTVDEAFEAAGDKFFDEPSVVALKTRPGTMVGNWIYYADYKPGHRYAMAVDPSEGIGRDNAVCVVWDFDARDENGYVKPSIVAIYVDNHTTPDALAHVAKDCAVRYGNCLIAVERNNHGHTTLAILKSIYYNLYKERKTDGGSDVETDRLGWHTNSASKPKMLYDLRTAILEKTIEIPDEFLKTELRSYPAEEVSNVKRDEDDTHWDRVVAAAIGFQMKDFASKSGLIIVPGEDDFNKFDLFNNV